MRFHCDFPSFGIQEELEFTLKGNLNFGWVSQVCRPNSRVPLLDLSGTDTSVPILKPRVYLISEPFPRSTSAAMPVCIADIAEEGIGRECG